MRELSVAERRYQAVLAVIKDGRTVTETAAAVGVSRQTLHTWRPRCWRCGGSIRRGRRHWARLRPGSVLSRPALC